MNQLALYHIALRPDADEAAFRKRMEALGDGTGILQLTRTTSGFDTRLLRRAGSLPVFAWHVTARLVTSAAYDFAGNAPALQRAIFDHGVVFGVDQYFDETPSDPPTVES